MKRGTIVAVCIGKEPVLAKLPCGETKIAEYGLLGDRHCTEMRWSFTEPRILKPNDRQITIVGLETLVAVNAELGLNLHAGDLGENFTTVGLGDFSDVTPGSNIRIGKNVVLQMVKQNQPCKNTAQIHPDFNKTIYKPENQRRGILCVVISGIGETVRSGDKISIL